MPSILNTGLSGLLTFQRALAVTSHNISNVHTDGYTRQRSELESNIGQATPQGFVGRGVHVDNVLRIGDQFAEARLTDAITDNGRTAEFAALAGRLDDLLAAGDVGLGPLMERFFASAQELANDPADPTPRRFMLSEAESLVSGFHFLDDQIGTLAGELNTRVEVLVADVNGLAEDIARINNAIVSSTGFARGAPPNDLLDQRQARINDLAALISVQTVEQDNGALNVFIGNGQGLVVNTTATPLTTRADPRDPSLTAVAVESPGQPIITEQLSGGSLGAVLDFRRDGLADARNALGRIAAVLGDTFNAQHRRGMDADGNLGGDFFSLGTPAVTAAGTNAGAATVSAAVVGASALAASDYRLDFDGAQFTLTRLADGAAQTGPGPFTVDGVQVSVAGAAAAGDSFLIRPLAFAAGQIQLAIVDPDAVAAADPVTGEAALGNLGDGILSAPATLDPANPALRDSVDIRFNDPPATFDVVDVLSGTPLASGVAFTAGAPIAFNGWSVRIDGQPGAGDRFRIEDNAGGIGDNRNALALAALQVTPTVEGRATFGESHAELVGAAGVSARQAGFNAEARERLLADAQSARDTVSGVNLDEEAVDLTRYQQAYQAMARVIDTSNSLFGELLAVVRS